MFGLQFVYVIWFGTIIWYGFFGLKPLWVLFIHIESKVNVWFNICGEVWINEFPISGKFGERRLDAYYALTAFNLPTVLTI